MVLNITKQNMAVTVLPSVSTGGENKLTLGVSNSNVELVVGTLVTALASDKWLPSDVDTVYSWTPNSLCTGYL